MKIGKIIRNLVILLIGVIVVWLIVAMLVYTPVYVFRTLAWMESDAFDWQKFPYHPLTAAPAIYQFDNAPDPRVADIFEQLSGADAE